MRYCAENGDSAPKPIKSHGFKVLIVEAVLEKPFLAEVALFLIVGLIVM